MSLRERLGISPRAEKSNLGSQNAEVIDTSRRALILQGGGLVAATAALPALERAAEINRLFGFSPLEIFGHDIHELQHPLLETVSPHTPDSLERTHIFVVGDSMARGYDRDDIVPKSVGENLRDIMNHPNGLQANWQTTVLAENGRTINDLMGQLNQIPDLARGEQDIDIVLSAGGNDFREYLQTKQQEAKDTYESVPEMIFNKFDQDIMKKLGNITLDYQRMIIPRLIALKRELAQNGTSLNRIAFINIPDLSKTNFEIHAEEVNLRIRYDGATDNSDERNEWVIKRLGKRLPYLGNMWIGHHIWEAREELGNIMWLNAYDLPAEKLNGIHATAEGQFDMAVQYLARTYMPDPSTQEQAAGTSLLALSHVV